MTPQSPVEQFIFRSSFLCAIFPLLISVCPAEENDSETFETDVTKWKIVDKPLFIEKHASDDPFATAANGFDFAWSVSEEKSKVSVSIHDDFAEHKLPFDATVDLTDTKKVAPFQAIKTGDGWIALYNQGEFGSAIYWFNDDGSQRKKISDHAVNDVIVVKNRIFAAEGLAHLSINEGSVIEIKKLNRQWVAQNFMTLPESAGAIAQLHNGDFVIATSSAIHRLTINKKLSAIVQNQDWPSNYPNSIASDEKFIYVGLYSYIVRYPLTGKSKEAVFLTP